MTAENWHEAYEAFADAGIIDANGVAQWSYDSPARIRLQKMIIERDGLIASACRDALKNE